MGVGVADSGVGVTGVDTSGVADGGTGEAGAGVSVMAGPCVTGTGPHALNTTSAMPRANKLLYM
jgi:hypothetical protein